MIEICRLDDLRMMLLNGLFFFEKKMGLSKGTSGQTPPQEATPLTSTTDGSASLSLPQEATPLAHSAPPLSSPDWLARDGPHEGTRYRPRYTNDSSCRR